MTMAYWNGMTWKVSEKEITYLESLTTAFSIETSTNADKEGKSATEQVANSLIEISLNTTYRVETGTRDVRGTMNAWKRLVGKTGPLVIGGSTFGPDKVQLQSVGVSNVQLDSRGTMRAVTLSFKFKEFVEESSGVTTVKSTTSTTKSTTTSTSSTSTKSTTSKTTSKKKTTTAVNVTASSTDKSSKKTTVMRKNANGIMRPSYKSVLDDDGRYMGFY